MKRTTRQTSRKNLPSVAEPQVKKVKSIVEENENDSSSDSDIEDYLQPAHEIDLNSSYFQVKPINKPEEVSFEDIEKNILGDTTLTKSESEDEIQEEIDNCEIKESRIHFQHLYDYTKKLEDAKEHMKRYNANLKTVANKSADSTILSMLTSVEATAHSSTDFSHNLTHHSSGFHSASESDNDWEEVEHNETEKQDPVTIPKEGVEIVLNLPNELKKKKKNIDLMASLKRKLNRIKKENQVFIHKVHVLSWIAHGNYVNQILNDSTLLALSLSIIPSQHCYPKDRVDLNYLGQVVEWYSKTIPIVDKPIPTDTNLLQLLRLQITQKESFTKSMHVYIFICLLRSLGIQCRLVLSFQLVPLKPEENELCSLSTKSKQKDVKSNSKKINADKPAESNKTSAKKEKPKVVKKIEKKAEVVKENSVRASSKTKPDKSSANSEKSKSGTENDRKLRSREPNKKNESKSDKPPKTTNKDKLSRKEINELFSKPKKPKISSRKDKSTSSDNSKTKTTDLIQVDGVNDSSEEENTSEKKQVLKKRPRRSVSTPHYAENTENDGDFSPDSSDSANDFISSSDSEDEHFVEKPPKTPNLSKLSSYQTKTKCSRGKHCKLKSTCSKLKKSLPDFSHLLPQSHSESTSTAPPNLKSLIKAKQLDVRNDIINIMSKRMAQEAETSKSKLVKNKRKISPPSTIARKKIDTDDEFVASPKIKKRIVVKTNEEGKVVAEDSKKKKKQGIDIWVEVFLEAEEKWISADVIRGRIHCVKELYSRASHPVCYVVAWNNDNTIKDITKRYCTQWNTVTRKLRVDMKWWEETLKPFTGSKTFRDREEDEDLARIQLDQPLPTAISEYKDHPLYVLQRHLLKFQAIYPPEIPPVGFVRKEAVYPRSSVFVLHSRDIWLKSAKVVKLGENPYKIVKARPKYDKLSGKVVSDQLLEIFGHWQVQDYDPPQAENGVVPRNAYGNVDLFKSCMLPKGTVHLQLPGLNKVAKKLGIDCAPAVVGFDFHSGWSHPTFDGFVVCEEHQDAVIAAWYAEQEEAEKREEEKIEKRVYGNWRRLIKALLIRERLQKKYDFKSVSQGNKRSKCSREDTKKLCTKERK